MNRTNDNCPLCKGESKLFYQNGKRTYLQCDNCLGLHVPFKNLPSYTDEHNRYLEHNNNVFDKKYQDFVSPITSSVLSQYSCTSKGLDFGAGTGPVIAKLLRDKKYEIALYDPFFHGDRNVLQYKYDYIACCEVIEHFHDPRQEFGLLKSLLVSKGKLFCMTDIYDESIDFHKWYYKNDLTHVFIYHRKSLAWIKRHFEFSDLSIENRLVCFTN